MATVAINAGSLRVMVDCQPAILSEIVSLALAGLPGIVLLGTGSDEADVVVTSALLNDAGGLGQLLEAIHRLLPEIKPRHPEEKR
jgi:hypothetical protein